MRKFHEVSSLKANIEKCEACLIGGAKDKKDQQVNCKWASLTENTIKILGVYFGYHKTLTEKEDFAELMVNCRCLFNIRMQRWLSFARKIQVFTSLVVSKPVLIATTKIVPKYVVEALHTLLKEFIWSGKKPKLKPTFNQRYYHIKCHG